MTGWGTIGAAVAALFLVVGLGLPGAAGQTLTPSGAITAATVPLPPLPPDDRPAAPATGMPLPPLPPLPPAERPPRRDGAGEPGAPDIQPPGGTAAEGAVITRPLLPPPAVPESRHRTGDSGLPLPRFVTVSASEANMRTGPGARYPIAWVYRHPGIPLEVIDEYDVWRQVRDVDGESGWMHQSLLSGRRTFVVVGADLAPVFAGADETAPEATPVSAWVAPYVMGEIVRCTPSGLTDADYCRVRVRDRVGWIERDRIWGVYPGERIE